MSRPMTHTELTALVAATSGVSVRTAQRRVLEMLKEGIVEKTEVGLYVLNEARVEATPAPVPLAPVPEGLLAAPLNKQAAQLFDFLLLRGASPNHAAAAVGNVYHTAAKGALSLS